MAAAIAFGGFTTIKSYTTFKLCSVRNCSAPSFTTIKNYTQLSNYYCGVPREIEVLLPLRITQLSNLFEAILRGRFTTIKNYTTLKHMHFAFLPVVGFTTIKNYTTLKQMSMVRLVPLRVVLLPLRITQLSNNKSIIFFGSDYSLAHKFRKCKGLCL